MAAALCLALALTAPRGARADDAGEQKAAARHIFNQGRELEKAGDWQGAYEKFKQVGEVVMTPQVRFHIALCDENLGRLVAAINGFELATEEAKRAGKDGKDVAENAPIRAEKLRARVPHLTIVVKGELRVSKVLLDGKALAAALVNTELPVDPGKHVITVERKGEAIETQSLELAEKERKTITLEVDDKNLPPEEPDKPPPPPQVTPPKLERPGTFEMTRERVPAVALVSVGVAAGIAAGVFYGLRESTIADVNNNAGCRPDLTGCDPAYQALAEDGKSYTVISGVLAGVAGAAALTGGVLWFALAKPRPAPSPAQTDSRKRPRRAELRAVTVSPLEGGAFVGLSIGY
jgi:hypothetical protein